MNQASAATSKSRSNFLRHVMTLGVGTTLAQAVPILISPVLTRLYNPEAFGMLALFMSLSAILGVAANGKYEFAILLPVEDEAAFTIVCLCSLLLVLSSFFLLLLSFGFSDDLSRMMRIDRGILLLVPAAVFFMGAFRVLSIWFNRREHYRTMSMSRILQTSATGLFGILFGLWEPRQRGLVWAVVLGYGLVDLLLVSLVIFRESPRWDRVTVSGMFNEAKTHSNFPKFTIFSSFLDMISMQMPLLLFPVIFSPTVAGWFALSQRVTKTPLNLIDRAVRDVFRQQASRDFMDRGDCTELFMVALKRLSFISVLPFAAIFALAPSLFSFVFGEEWRVAGDYTRIMVLSYWLQFISNPLGSILMIAGKQRLNMFIQIINVVGVVLAMIIGHIFENVKYSLYLLVVSGCIKYIIQIIISYISSFKRTYDGLELSRS